MSQQECRIKTLVQALEAELGIPPGELQAGIWASGANGLGPEGQFEGFDEGQGIPEDMSHGMGVTDFLEQAHRAHLEREERRRWVEGISMHAYPYRSWCQCNFVCGALTHRSNRVVRHRSTCLAKYLQSVSGPCKYVQPSTRSNCTHILVVAFEI